MVSAKRIYLLATPLLLTGLVLLSSCDSKHQYADVSQEPNTNMAIYQTDQYVWEKMARSFQVKTETPENMNWELWASEEYTYQNPCGQQPWPTKGIPVSKMPPKAIAFLDNISNDSSNFKTTNFAILTLNFDNPYYEELRLNRPMFEYIQNNGLYNQDTVYHLAKQRKISFPQEAMMIKAQWTPLEEGDSLATKYYTKRISAYNNYTDEYLENQLMGLVGFHLVTHELPNWVWSTFEFSGNPGICDYIGCKDDFGTDKPYIPPHKIVNQGYDTGSTTPALAALFKEFGVPEVFKNYRLKGSQTEFTTSEGKPTILGNSILEMNLVSSSSCISCHARATLNNVPRGSRNLVMFTDSMTFDVINKPTATKGFHPTGYTGAPEYEDYLNGNADPDSTYYPTDFMWQLAQIAQPCSND